VGVNVDEWSRGQDFFYYGFDLTRDQRVC